MTRRRSTTKGFSQAASLMQTRIREGMESRGFAVMRLLTHWNEVVGDEIAAMATPVKVGYARGGIGATLTILTRGSHAPLLDMQRDRIRDKVNACYGYNAISRVTITQTAPTGFAEGQVAFAPAPKRTPPAPSPEIMATARGQVTDVQSDDLRRMLELLGANIMTKQTNRSPS